MNELLAGGASGGVDVEDMSRHATYTGGYSASDHTVKLFWKVCNCALAARSATDADHLYYCICGRRARIQQPSLKKFIDVVSGE